MIVLSPIQARPRRDDPMRSGGHAGIAF